MLQPVLEFENDVKMYGTQAWKFLQYSLHEFENDVKMYGTQAATVLCFTGAGLRMM